MQDFSKSPVGENDIAIVGMAAHLPGAGDLAAYWRLLAEGICAIRRFSDEELLAAGEDPARLHRPDYVPFGAPLEGFADFDPEFFGFSPKEAAILDPQHRQFLEVGWEALENAGHMPENFAGDIGVYAGCGMGSYFYFNICSNRDLVDDVGMFLLRHTGNDKDFLPTRLSHILDLKGPSVGVQTACSTSLVAVHYAVQALLGGECDMAIAGGVTLEIPQIRGYIYKEGEVLSPDGACHAFDHRAQGTVFGSGAGAVVLRRAREALADGDHVWAIIRATAVNNDGADKAGYLAPSVSGQAAAVADALALADVPADSIGYVECHGTGTYLGDPIEVAALTEAFRRSTDAVGTCRIGSVKTNIGHLDTAAGVAGLIKAALALKHGQIPPSLGYERPNPVIDFDGSPFRVADRLTDWPRRDTPRRAGVNALGVGGTNAHAILEEAPARRGRASDWPFHPLVLSARSRPALEDQAARLAAHLRANPDLDLADVAWTLRQGRRAFEHRRVVVAETPEQAAELLEAGDPRRVFTHQVLEAPLRPVFMFPGGGAQYPGMARDLYETEPVFAEWMDRGLELLAPLVDYDIRALWLPEGEAARARAEERLRRPSVQLPLILITEVALAELWKSWGVEPAVLVGHSMGENTAACVAGVMSLKDAIGLVHLRGTLFDSVPAGGMLSVPLPAEDLRAFLGEELDIAAENAPGLSVASGPAEALAALEARLAEQGIEARRIAIDIAAHSRMLEPILGRFRAYLEGIELRPPQIPVVSNRTGRPITEAQATDPGYWVDHLRHMVRFGDCIAGLAADPGHVFIEVGPGRALASLAGANPAVGANRVISSLRHPDDPVGDDAHFVAALARIWALGGDFDWGQIWGEGGRLRLPLPSYPFQRATYYIEPAEGARERRPLPMRLDDMRDWGNVVRWRKAWVDSAAEAGDLTLAERLRWLVFVDEAGLGEAVVERLRAGGQEVVTVRVADAFGRDGADGFFLAPEAGRAGYDELLRTLVAEGRAPDRIAHFWLVTRGRGHRAGSSFFHRNLEQGFWSLLFLAQAWEAEGPAAPLQVSVITTGAARVAGEVLAHPEKATVAGPARVWPREAAQVGVGLLDVVLPEGRRGGPAALAALAGAVIEELFAEPGNRVAALRDGVRHEQDHRPLPLEEEPLPPVAPGSVWMITGGFGGIGLSVAEELVRRWRVKLVLLARTPLPPRTEWTRASGAVARRIAAVEALEALGAEVEVLAGDVTNIDDMRRARVAAEARFGRVDGVIHAAGVIDDAPIAAKGVGAIEEVLGPKLHGVQVLEQVFPDGDLDWLVLFSSTSVITAPAGQADYVAANAWLDAWACARAGGRTRVVALDWGIWADRGMAAEALGAGGGGDSAARPVDLPLLADAVLDGAGDRVFRARLGCDDWVIGEHRLKDGTALLPGTGYLELAAEAMLAQGEGLGFEMRDMAFLRPLVVGEGEARAVRVRLRRSDEGYALDITSVVEVAGRRGHVTHAEARLIPGLSAVPAALDVAGLWARMGEAVRAAPGERLAAAQAAQMDFGPRWQVLERYALGEGEGVAELALGRAAAGDAGWLLHPALMDIATGWAMALIPGYGGRHLWVPVSYGALRLYRVLPGRVVSWVRLAEAAPGSPYARFDVVLADADGAVLAEVEGLVLRRLEGGLALAAPSEVEFDDAGGRALSAGEERLRHNLSQGIPAAQGGAAFVRALGRAAALDLPRVVVSSMPLGELVAQVEDEARAAAAPAPGFDRPELEQDFVAPEGALEETLAGFYQELLGVGRVGALDSFFDLGGHSLIAVRLFAKIRRTWGVELPISTLFEAPDIRSIAALLVAAGVSAGPGEGGQEAAPAPASAPASARPRFTHLVAMHEGEGGPRTPFFLVAGMFGNVLNLRHLAHLLGADRPFYGLQARGLLGGEAPHDTIPEAAAAMIAEMRQVHAGGPWLVGGFSGGGITAWEIARQLCEAGEEVALVAMLDTPLPQRRPLSLRDRALIQLAELRAGGLAYPLRWLVRRVKWEFSKRRRRGEEAPSATPQFHNAAIEAAFLRAVAAYEPQPWAGNLVLLRPPLRGKWVVSGGALVSSERAYVTDDNDWRRHAPNMRVIEVPGDHDSMVLEPNVRVLAQALRDEIARAEGDAPAADGVSGGASGGASGGVSGGGLEAAQ